MQNHVYLNSIVSHVCQCALRLRVYIQYVDTAHDIWEVNHFNHHEFRFEDDSTVNVISK